MPVERPESTVLGSQQAAVPPASTLAVSDDERRTDPSTPQHRNVEGETEFDVRWAWADGALTPGFTAVLRVKDEARSLPWVIPPLLRAVRRVVLADNRSTDGSADIARDVATEMGAADRLQVVEYPFDVARYGPEHLATPADSVHSPTYFYNWSFAHVRTQYALKWDGDMVMSDGLVSILRDLEWQLEGKKRVVAIPRIPLYVADDRRAFVEIGFRNAEPWGWPNAPGYEFYKGFEWELCPMPARKHRVYVPDWLCIELKHLDTEEFSHWSHTEFGATARTERKEREWSVFRALQAGDDPPEGVVAVEAPAGEHVIDFVRSRWLPALAAEAQPT